jgi:hypothetical protein
MFLQKLFCILRSGLESTTLSPQSLMVQFVKQVPPPQSYVLDFITYDHPYITILGLDAKYLGFSGYLST